MFKGSCGGHRTGSIDLYVFRRFSKKPGVNSTSLACWWQLQWKVTLCSVPRNKCLPYPGGQWVTLESSSPGDLSALVSSPPAIPVGSFQGDS